MSKIRRVFNWCPIKASSSDSSDSSVSDSQAFNSCAFDSSNLDSRQSSFYKFDSSTPGSVSKVPIVDSDVPINVSGAPITNSNISDSDHIKVFEFLVILCRIVKQPFVYRSFQLPNNATFETLHLAIQSAFEWTTANRYEFWNIKANTQVNEISKLRKLNSFFFEGNDSCYYQYHHRIDNYFFIKITLLDIKFASASRDFPDMIVSNGTSPREDFHSNEEFYQFIDEKEEEFINDSSFTRSKEP